MTLLFRFLGSYYSCVYNLGQGYLLDFIISFMVAIVVFVMCLCVVLVFFGGGIKNFNFNKKVLEF